MANEFDGDVTELSDEQIKLIQHVFYKEGFSDTNIKVLPIGKKGDNYIADVVRLQAEKDGETLSLIAKIAPKQENVREFAKTGFHFQNEATMYLRVLPKFIEMQKESGMPQDKLLRVPTFYGAITDKPNEIILLEDLNTSGFSIRNRFGFLTNEEIRLVLRQHAMIHSLGFVLKEKDPDFFHVVNESLVDLWARMTQNPELTKMTIVEQVLKIVDPEFHKSVQDTLLESLENGVNLKESEANSKFVTILHADSWTNNIMFNMGANNKMACIFIDYQLSKVGSPASDILYPLFNCVDRETRQKHFYDWIDFYYKEFDDSLSYFNMEASKVYPREKLDEDLRNYGKHFYGISICLASFLLRDPDDIKSFEDVDPTNVKALQDFYDFDGMNEVTFKRFQKRVVELTQCCSDFGYL